MDHSGCFARLVKIVEWPEPRHQLPFFTLGALGLYFGQYFSVQGIKYGTPVLAGIWQNVIPATTFLVGLALGTEKVQCNTSSILQVVGVALGVGGAVASSYAPEVSASGGSAAKACAFYALQVLFGGAGFWHLQKRLLTGRVQEHGSGRVVLLLRHRFDGYGGAAECS